VNAALFILKLKKRLFLQIPVCTCEYAKFLIFAGNFQNPHRRGEDRFQRGIQQV
jgi:hypothetical protein